jgi:hypothetical protein
MPAGADQEARSAPPSNGEVYAYLRCYLRLMRELFGRLIFNPLVLPLDALEAPGGAGALAGNGACLPACLSASCQLWSAHSAAGQHRICPPSA